MENDGAPKPKSKTQATFLQLLQIASILPKANKELTTKYQLTRQQIYLLYLIYIFQQGSTNQTTTLVTYANLLNISPSTFTRNVEKLEARRLIERVKLTQTSKATGIKLLSMGQLYSIEIDKFMREHFTKNKSRLNF